MNVFLKPGELYISDKPAVVSTILGSCVSITIFSKRLKIGAICHAILPKNPFTEGHDAFRYVDSSIYHLFNELRRMGIDKKEMEIKLLGGADVLEHTNGNGRSVGQQNIQTALEIMKNENIKPVGSDVGGSLGRKIHFYAHTGKVLLRRIESVQNLELTTRGISDCNSRQKN